jgi:hypothetical protein
LPVCGGLKATIGKAAAKVVKICQSSYFAGSKMAEK